MTLAHEMLRSNKCGFVGPYIVCSKLINTLSQFVLNLKESNTRETGLLCTYIITATNVKKKNQCFSF